MDTNELDKIINGLMTYRRTHCRYRSLFIFEEISLDRIIDYLAEYREMRQKINDNDFDNTKGNNK